MLVLDFYADSALLSVVLERHDRNEWKQTNQWNDSNDWAWCERNVSNVNIPFTRLV